jgi:hypothetical protein
MTTFQMFHTNYRGNRVGFVSKIIDRRRILRTLPDYPVYSPPFHDSEAVLAKREIRANYDYFLEQKARRLEYLTNYLRSFSVHLSLSPQALSALDGWYYRYGGHLVPIGGEAIGAMQDHEPAWDGDYRGINIVHDISIFAGDYIVSRSHNVRWDVNFGDGTRRDYEELGFGQPCLVGLRHTGCDNGAYSILHEVYDFCDAARWRLKEGNRMPKSWMFKPGEFAKRLAYLADPNPPPVIPFSQLTMDD